MFKKLKKIDRKNLLELIMFSLFIAGMWFGYYIVEHKLITHAIVEGSSMEPTYYDAETLIFANHIKPEKGEVAVFKMDESYIIKRVIATPGDRIKIENSTVYVNGEPLDEEYIKEATFNGHKYEGLTLTLNEGEYFLMGDNRNNSLDSRRRGPFKESSLAGTVLFHKKQK